MFEFDSISILAMLVIGLMGAGHCVGMCGGIVAALGFAADDQRRRWPILLSYNLGRITSYGLIGALVGLLGLFGHGLSVGGNMPGAIFSLSQPGCSVSARLAGPFCLVCYGVGYPVDWCIRHWFTPLPLLTLCRVHYP